MPGSLKVVPTGSDGARIEGIDLRTAATAEIDVVMQAWYHHDVQIFLGQQLSDEHLLALTRRFGALGDGEALWHTDISYAALPPDASMLFALEIPATGADTCFASMKAALEKVPVPLRMRIATLDIKPDGTYDSGGNLRKGDALSTDPRSSTGTPHPIVIEHPVSGDRALYLGWRRNAYVMGLEPDESERLLDQLWRCVDASVYLHRWTLGDLVLWDNRTTMHRRDPFDPRSRRVMHRTQIKGTSPPRRAQSVA